MGQKSALVLGESHGSRCQPTAAPRGKPMTSTKRCGGHGFVPPKPMRVQDADTTKLSRTGIRPDVAKGVAKLPSSLERRQGRRSRAPRAPRPVRRPSSWRPAGGLASDRIGDFAARIFSPRAPRPRLRPGVRQEEPRRAQAPSLALAVVPAPLVLGESCGSRCQPTAAARGKPMTSTTPWGRCHRSKGPGQKMA